MRNEDGWYVGDEEGGGGVSEINITPLVDVCLVLVLIFMVTSPFMSKQLVDVRLPRASTSETEAKENITISLSPSEGWSVNEVPVERQALYHELQHRLKTSGFTLVLIRADEDTPHGEVEDVMKICKKAKVPRIAFATNPQL
jgi:biopolymer transport protein ExbD